MEQFVYVIALSDCAVPLSVAQSVSPAHSVVSAWCWGQWSCESGVRVPWKLLGWNFSAPSTGPGQDFPGTNKGRNRIHCLLLGAQKRQADAGTSLEWCWWVSTQEWGV